MKTTLMIVLCSAAILASGCATSHRHAVTYEYGFVQGRIADQLQDRINKAAADGWQVVTVQGQLDTVGYAVIKRAKK